MDDISALQENVRQLQLALRQNQDIATDREITRTLDAISRAIGDLVIRIRGMADSAPETLQLFDLE